MKSQIASGPPIHSGLSARTGLGLIGVKSEVSKFRFARSAERTAGSLSVLFHVLRNRTVPSTSMT